jgi:hypothetical protein
MNDIILAAIIGTFIPLFFGILSINREVIAQKRKLLISIIMPELKILNKEIDRIFDGRDSEVTDSVVNQVRKSNLAEKIVIPDLLCVYLEKQKIAKGAIDHLRNGICHVKEGRIQLANQEIEEYRKCMQRVIRSLF